MSAKPTMETDTEMVMCDCGVDYVPVALARALERERDEARAECDTLYARHERGQILCRSCDRYVIEVNALREALRELVNSFDGEDYMLFGYQLAPLNRARALLGNKP